MRTSWAVLAAMKNVPRGKKQEQESNSWAEKEAKVRNRRSRDKKGKRAETVKGSEIEAKKGDGADQKANVRSEAATEVLTDATFLKQKSIQKRQEPCEGTLLIISLLRRDARTVFCMQLAAGIRPRDLEEFFSTEITKVRDMRMISDRNSRRSKRNCMWSLLMLAQCL